MSVQPKIGDVRCVLESGEIRHEPGRFHVVRYEFVAGFHERWDPVALDWVKRDGCWDSTHANGPFGSAEEAAEWMREHSDDLHRDPDELWEGRNDG